jgi:hypothetical protein
MSESEEELEQEKNKIENETKETYRRLKFIVVIFLLLRPNIIIFR